MPIPSYGAAPLSKTFALVRMIQVVAMVCIVGLAANFVSEIVSSYMEPPKEFVGTLSITCIAALYVLVSMAFYWSEANLGLLIMAGVDALLLIAFIVVAVVLGKPISYLDCRIAGNASAQATAQSAYAFTQSVKDNLTNKGPYFEFAGTTKVNCYEVKALWGLSIALCILFTTSIVLLPTLFFKNKKAQAAPPKVVV